MLRSLVGSEMCIRDRSNSTLEIESRPQESPPADEDIVFQENVLSVEEELIADSLPPVLDDTPELDNSEKAELQEHTARAMKKFNSFDKDGSGYLDGAELHEVATWVWTSFHPGGEKLSPELVREEAAKICRRVDENTDGKMSLDEFAGYFQRTSEAITRFRKKNIKKKAVAKRMGHEFSEREKQEQVFAELNLMAELPVGLCDDAPPLTDNEAHQVDQQSIRAQKKFQNLDADQSGVLNGPELLDLAAWVWRSFNPDKEPEQQQIQSEATKILRRIDTNEDGDVDFHEFAAYYSKTAVAIARFHKGRASKREKQRKKGGSRTGSRPSSRLTTPSQSPIIQAKFAAHSSCPDTPLELPDAEEECCEKATSMTREELNSLDAKEYLDMAVMGPMLEGLHLVSANSEPDPFEFLAQYLIDNDPLKDQQTEKEYSSGGAMFDEGFKLPEMQFQPRHGLFKL
eukprot:TRINITY_DN16845_c0_g1_i1.p1 TRINITY_DN16845_c0_g1~~TRINITY_DN16845_c0_g1_i1.p1  ORF type:complete len:458 (+),score=148.30 TRINITY_DN16845_c0_g1_i1:98-1471(+)